MNCDIFLEELFKNCDDDIQNKIDEKNKQLKHWYEANHYKYGNYIGKMTATIVDKLWDIILLDYNKETINNLEKNKEWVIYCIQANITARKFNNIKINFFKCIVGLIIKEFIEYIEYFKKYGGSIL